MESIPKDPILQYPPDTLHIIRKSYNLDKPGQMDEAIHILNEWIKKQNHFVKKNFDKGYLERTIISSKGSLERAKVKIDKICTLRTLMPQFYTNFSTRDDLAKMQENMYLVPLPKFTEDYYRVGYMKMNSNANQEAIMNFYRFTVVVFEYIRANDYVNGVICISDLRDVSILELIKNMNILDLRQISTLVIEGFGLRVKGIHFLTSSTAIEMLLTILKQILSKKISERIMVHKSLDSLYHHVPKEILPVECGGNERSFRRLNDEWLDVLSSKQHIKYMKEIKDATTDERCRQSDKFNDQYMGMPGTFRSLKVD